MHVRLAAGATHTFTLAVSPADYTPHVGSGTIRCVHYAQNEQDDTSVHYTEDPFVVLLPEIRVKVDKPAHPRQYYTCHLSATFDNQLSHALTNVKMTVSGLSAHAEHESGPVAVPLTTR